MDEFHKALEIARKEITEKRAEVYVEIEKAKEDIKILIEKQKANILRG